MADPRPAGRATLLVGIAACGFASISIAVSLALRSGAPLVDVLVGRYAIAAPLLAVVAWAGGARRFSPNGARAFAMLGIMQALIAYTSLLALDYIPAGTLSFLFYTYPAWIAVLARLLHSEPLTRVRLTALVLSLAGVLVMVGSPSAARLHPTGVTLAVASALLYAIYIPMLARAQQRLSAAATAANMAGGAAVVFLLAKLFSGGGPALHLTLTGWEAAVWLAVVSTTIAFLLFLRGLKTLGPVRTGIVSTIEPFATAVMGAVLLSQPMTFSTIVGGAFIACAVVLLQLRSDAPAPAQAPA
jgi:drug/metabolite transporter (DMT)-like permease